MIKKTDIAVDNFQEVFELNELYWFIKSKPRTQSRENIYLITMVSRRPRQIVGFDVAFDKSPNRIQRTVDNAPPSSKYGNVKDLLFSV